MSEWTPTTDLRWVAPKMRFLLKSAPSPEMIEALNNIQPGLITTAPDDLPTPISLMPRLQQRWVLRMGLAAAFDEEEWRDVPTVEEAT